jgi:hypothetical protein
MHRKYELHYYSTLSDFKKGIEYLKTATVEATSFDDAEAVFKAKYGKPYMFFQTRLIPLKSDEQRPQ